jgi:dephospho-CoA kinase
MSRLPATGRHRSPPVATSHQQPPAVLIVALTGNIASGKSSVARLLAAKGARIIDADVLAREVVERGSAALGQIAERWGARVLRPDGSLDRAALRDIVFTAPEELEALNAITHPRVEQRRRALLDTARAEGVRVVVCDIPLLFEKGMERSFDLVILVDAPEAVRRERLVTERGLSLDEADRMIAAQMPSSAKRARADVVIDNDASLEELARRTDALWDDLEHRSRTPRIS